LVSRLLSLRLWLLTAMLIAAAVGLAAAVFLFRHVETSHEHVADAAKARKEARAIAANVQRGAGPAQLAALQSVLVNDRVTVVRNGRVVFRGPSRAGRELELQQQVSFPGGFVRVYDYASPGPSNTLALTLITGGVLVLVILAAVGTATVVTRAVRVPVRRAINAAERVSHGEFSARMGTSGPEELVKLGRAFDDMATRLERADRDQRQFLADVAHEIATPVNAVSGFALALADGAARGSEERAEAQTVIEAETGRLRDLLNDLRQLTRLDLAEGVRLGPVALKPFAEKLVASVRHEADANGLELTYSVRGQEAFTDARLLQMAISNLLSNAIRYTPAGGRVQLAVREHGDQLIVSVRDTGIGISPEHQSRIFERLYRVDSTRDRATGGSGLGLAIASRAVQTLGGHIELDSVPGRGSEFRVLLPRVGVRASPATPSESA
jgi:signal transduction histidine kinase